MKNTRVIVNHAGGPEELQVISESLPEPKTGEYRVDILAVGVSYADLLMREGVHPETPPVPFTPGWDLVGRVEKAGDGCLAYKPGQTVAALPVVGAYAEYITLPEKELIPVPAGVNPAEAVSLVLNYVTAYQMLHRAAKVRDGQRILVHAAAGGVGSALLQLGQLGGLEMYGTASSGNHDFITSLGAVPIDYRQVDFVDEILRLTGDGIDVVFDGIGGRHVWRSYRTLRPGGRVISYGLASSLEKGQLLNGKRGRIHGLPIMAAQIALSHLIPDRKRITLYSIQTLKRIKPAYFREDVSTLFELLAQGKIKPLIAAQFPLTEVDRAHELLAKGIKGKIVLNGINHDRSQTILTTSDQKGL
jgi:NADPH:quinone reductase-like Zn-dependent oxidoreductase